MGVLFSQKEKVIFMFWNSEYREIASDTIDKKASIFKTLIMKGPGLRECVILSLCITVVTPTTSEVFLRVEGSMLVENELEKKKMLTIRVIIILAFIDNIINRGFIIIETLTESNRKSLDLAGLRQTHESRT